MSNNHRLTVVVITKNEEKNIERCLNSVLWADEIIVVDSGSEDRTVELAQSLGAKVIERDWPGDGPQKHFAISQVKTNWCLVLDADEQVMPQLKTSILKAMEKKTHSAFKIKRESFFLGKKIAHGNWGHDWIVRLFDATKHRWTQDTVHSKLDVDKKQAPQLQGILLHHTQDSLDIALKKSNDYTSVQAQTQHQAKKTSTLLKALLHKKWAFWRSFIFRAGFLDGKRGYLIAKLTADSAFYKHAKLWALKQDQ